MHGPNVPSGTRSALDSASRTNKEATVRAFGGSPEKVADKLAASVPVSPDEIKRLLKSSTSSHTSLIINVNGEQHTYDTTSGISPELIQKLAQQMGISVSELATLLKLPGHSDQGSSSVANAGPRLEDEAHYSTNAR